MHPTIATELAAARHAELLREAEHRRRVRVARDARPAGRPVLTTLTTAVTEAAQRLRRSAGELARLRAPEQSAVEPCCA
jgi:hypothetical protein